MSAPVSNAAAASYAASGFSNRMGWGKKPALLLINVCKAYWDTFSPLNTSSNPAAAAAPACIGRLVAAARAAKVPIIWTKVSYTSPDMSDAGLFYQKAKALTCFQGGDERGLDGWVEGLEPAKGEQVVVKQFASAFFGTTLASLLTNSGVDTVVIGGVSTSGCVRASALDAMQNGFRPMVRCNQQMK